MQKNEDLKKELENVMVYISDLKEIKEKIEEREEDFDKMKTAFPSDHDAPALFLFLKEKIEENNLIISGDMGNFSSVPYSGTGSNNRIKEVKFDISFSGKYEDIKNFIKETEKTIRIIRTDKMNISFEPFFETEKELYVTISAVAYSY